MKVVESSVWWHKLSELGRRLGLKVGFKLLNRGLWIRIRKNMRIHGPGSNGKNINQKLQKKIFLLSDYKNCIILKMFHQVYSIKISEKKET